MRTVTFDTQVHDGIIKIPEKYKNLENRDIEVILLVKNSETVPVTKNTKTHGSARGLLRQYKNPELVSEEKKAWERAVKEKYAHR